MDRLVDGIVHLFDRLSDPWKAILLLVLVGLLVGLGIWKYADFRQKSRLRRELRRVRSQLKDAEDERNQLRKRLESLDVVDTHVWRRPDTYNQNSFASVEGARRKTRFVAFCNFKGGVGKTTLAVNLGACLAAKGRQVLLIDLDFQGSLSNLVLAQDRLGEYRDKKWTAARLLEDSATPQLTEDYSFPASEIPNCRVIISDETLEVVEFAQQARFYVDERHEVRFLLQRLLHRPDLFSKYDYVFLDCPPRLSTACVNALTCSDYIVTPTSLSQSDIDAVPRTLNWLKHLRGVLRASFLGAIVSRCNLRGKSLIRYERGQHASLAQQIARHARDLPGDAYIFEHMIPVKPIVYQSASESRPAAMVSEEGRSLFGPVADELERRIHQ